MATNPNIGPDSANSNFTETRLLSILPEARVVIRSLVAPILVALSARVSPGTYPSLAVETVNSVTVVPAALSI